MKVGLVRASARTTTGTTDFTVSGYGTCKGAIFYLTRATTDATAVDEAVLGYGATDGTRDRVCSTSSQHGQAGATNDFKRAKTGKCVMLIDPSSGAIDGEAQFDSFITDGIRINTTDAFAAGYKITAKLFFGSDVSIRVDTIDTSAGAVTTTAPGFTLRLLNVFGIRNTINDTALNGAAFSNGWATYDGTTILQNSMNWGEEDATATGAPYMRVETAAICRDLQNAAVGSSLTLGTITSTGFTLTPSGIFGFPMMYVAIKCDNRAHLTTYSSRTTTGTSSYTTSGMHPHAVFGWSSRIRTAGANNETALAGAFGFVDSTSASNEFSASLTVEDAAATTNTESICDAIFEHLPAHDGSDGAGSGLSGDVQSYDATGFTVNWTVVDSTNRRMFGAVVVQELESTALAPAAARATAALSVKRIHQTTLAVSASRATASLSGKVVHKTSLAVSARRATAALSTQVVHQVDQLAAAIGRGLYLRSNDLSWSIDSATVRQFSIEAWIYPNNVTTLMVGQWGASPSDMQYSVQFVGPSIAFAILDSTGSEYDLDWPIPSGYSGKRWYQVVCTVDLDAQDIRLYIDGVLAKQDVGPADMQDVTASTTSFFFVGNEIQVPRYSDGRFQRVRRWERVLSPSDVTSLWNGSKGKRTSALSGGLLTNLTHTADLDEYSPGTSRLVTRVNRKNPGTGDLTDIGGTPSGGGYGFVPIASRATITVPGKVVHQTTDGSVAASRATAALNVSRIHIQATIAASASRATAAISDKLIHQTTDGSVAASRATGAIAAKTVHQTTDGSVAASSATAALSSKTVHQTTDGSVSASTATTAIAAKRVHQTSLAVQASRATTSISASTVVDTDVAVSAARATAAVAAKVVHQTTDGSVQASTASASVTAKRVHQTSLAVSAARATVSVSARVVHQTSLAVTAQRATCAIAGDVSSASATNVHVSAQRATADLNGQTVHQTALAPTAARATTALPSKLVHQTTDGTVAASRATTAITAKRVIQTSLAVSASRATCAVNAQKKTSTTLAVSALRATASVSSKVVHQTSLHVTASRATCAIDASFAGGRIHTQASRATTAIDGQVVHRTALAVQARPAHVAISVSHIHQTALAVQASRASAHLTGQFVYSATIAAQARRATAALTGKVVHQVALALHARPATTALAVQRIHQSSLLLHATNAITHISGGQGFITVLTVSAQRARASLSGQVVHQGLIQCDAEPPRVRILDYPVVWYTPFVVFIEMREQLVLETDAQRVVMLPLETMRVLEGPKNSATIFLDIPESLP